MTASPVPGRVVAKREGEVQGEGKERGETQVEHALRGFRSKLERKKESKESDDRDLLCKILWWIEGGSRTTEEGRGGEKNPVTRLWRRPADKKICGALKIWK